MTNFTMLVCNRPRLTKQALESLNGTSKKDISFTISEDCKCDDETSAILSQFKTNNFDNVHLCGHTADYGTGPLRNQVITASEKYFGRGEYLYLSDNDVFFQTGWLEKLIQCYEACQRISYVTVLGAYNHPYHIPENEGFHILHKKDNSVSVVRHVQALALQSMIMKWEVWDKYGPFCDTPPGKVCQSEDVDFARKIHADGGKLGVVSPALVVNTGITNSFGEKIPGWEQVKAQCPEGVICE